MAPAKMIDEFTDKALRRRMRRRRRRRRRGHRGVCVWERKGKREREKERDREGANERECGHMHDLTHLDLQTMTFPIGHCSYDIILSSVKLKIYQGVGDFH